MNTKRTVDVYCGLQHGCILNAIPSVKGMAFDSARLSLENGLNEGVDREVIEDWLSRNKNLSIVKRGDVRIINGDKLAIDISRK